MMTIEEIQGLTIEMINEQVRHRDFYIQNYYRMDPPERKPIYDIQLPIHGTDYWYYDRLWLIPEYQDWANGLPCAQTRIYQHNMVDCGFDSLPVFNLPIGGDR